MMKKILSTAAAGLILASTAIAGLVQPQVVQVDLTTRFAQGDQVTARYSKNKVELIGCGIRKVQDGSGGTFDFGFCQATTADDVGIICQTQDAALLSAIESSGDFGFITFSWNELDECTRIGFSNQSFYLPEKLKSNN